jgi:DNA-directed RNA polymerase subunit RPC12/RpoP
MELYEFEPWINVVIPFPGESISHFLGRFERSNQWSAYQIGRVTELGGVVSRWKKLYFNPFPSQEELEALAKVVELEVETLRSMLPKKGIIYQPRPIRLCAACYGKEPYHRIEWQFKSVTACDRHKLRLLEKCPKCKKPFEIPALWEDGACSRCSTSIVEMVKSQGGSKR